MGKTFVTLPHLSYGVSAIGPKKMPGEQWEIRSLHPCSPYTIDNKVLSWLSLTNDDAEQMATFSSNLRRKIRKSQSMGFTVETGHTNLIDDFYRLFSRNMHRLGAPAMEQAFYHNIVSQVGVGHARVFILYRKHRVAGGAILLFHHKMAESCWLTTDPAYHHLYTTYLLHWSMISWSIAHQMSIYSFGRSTKNSGVHRYKQQWGTTDHTLYRNFSHPVSLDLRNNPILAKTWKYTPSPLTTLLGPPIARLFY